MSTEIPKYHEIIDEAVDKIISNEKNGTHPLFDFVLTTFQIEQLRLQNKISSKEAKELEKYRSERYKEIGRQTKN